MRLYAVLFAIGLVVFGTVAWDRVGRQSAAPHFVYQAEAWLHGHASIDAVRGDDWAKVETVALDDGSEVSGRRLKTRAFFRTLDGTEIPVSRLRRSLSVTNYVSFPAFPTLLMIPSAIISGRAGNDNIPTILIAALILPLTLLLLRRLAEAGLSKRTQTEDLWLVATLAFGTVMFFTVAIGGVWYTAHVVGVVLALLYAWASIEARHPLIAGLALGAAAMTRTPMAFMFPLFLFEAWRLAARQVAEADGPEANASGSLNLQKGKLAVRKAIVAPLVRFAIPVVCFAIAGMIYNYVRFGSPTEFGHNYLDVIQQLQIEQYGLANYHYLGRNLAVAFTLLPDLVPRAPYISIGGHGLAMWFTTPLLLFVLWPRQKPAIHRALWVTIAAVALPSLLYQNSGWFQFGYRFSLDYLVFLIMLIAIGGRPFKRVAKTLIIAGILINLFGAITFQRKNQYYRGGGKEYECVVPN